MLKRAIMYSIVCYCTLIRNISLAYKDVNGIFERFCFIVKRKLSNNITDETQWLGSYGREPCIVGETLPVRRKWYETQID